MVVLGGSMAMRAAGRQLRSFLRHQASSSRRCVPNPSSGFFCFFALLSPLFLGSQFGRSSIAKTQCKLAEISRVWKFGKTLQICFINRFVHHFLIFTKMQDRLHLAFFLCRIPKDSKANQSFDQSHWENIVVMVCSRYCSLL